ncbi:UNVERIFIED_CONTAM: hypothetical protein HDU68_010466 [Siphonaria sp. JEL0065]|nr:hypothetical protein HDU68_010466 [Siphonaria sp. JEL0065]
MTVSLVVIMVELTGALKLVLPLMAAVMVSKWTADSLVRDSTYDSTIKRNDFPYLDHKKEHHPPRGSNRSMAFAGDVAEYDLDAAFQVDLEYSLPDVEEKLKLLSYMDDGGFAVLDGQTLLGYIGFQDVKHATSFPEPASTNVETERQSTETTTMPPSSPTSYFYFRDPSTITSSFNDLLAFRGSKTLSGRDLTPWMDQAPLTVSCRASMDLVLELFMKVGCKTVCVVDGAGGGAGRFMGVLTKKRVIAWLKQG